AAFTHLQKAVDSGWSSGGVLAEVTPALAVLADDPRFAAIEATMLATTNRDREIVGLPPLNENYEPLQEPVSERL
ncbi:MAG: hypothetical protein L0Y45_10655, partial [Woeseiaceae bacterium]|nr:hypothetical protein [Woeseiaceae bacterium]